MLIFADFNDREWTSVGVPFLQPIYPCHQCYPWFRPSSYGLKIFPALDDTGRLENLPYDEFMGCK